MKTVSGLFSNTFFGAARYRACASRLGLRAIGLALRVLGLRALLEV